MSRILLAIARFDYGRPEWGDSFEYTNFKGPLERLGHQVRVFDTFTPQRHASPDTSARELLSCVREFEPDLVLCLLADSEIPLDCVREVGRHTVIVNWFADDVWRFDWYSRRVAPAFSWALTTSRRAERRYSDSGVRAVFLPWAANTAIFHPRDGQIRHNVSFVGQRHGGRGKMVERLRADGINVYARGGGWEEGRATWSEMAEVFASSRVNLSFTESSAGPLRRRGWSARGVYRADSLLQTVSPPAPQMKARPFEIAASGGLALTGPFDELDECFTPGKDVAVARSYQDWRSSIVSLLDDEERRQQIASSALQRCLAEHTYERRFNQLFEHIQLTARA